MKTKKKSRLINACIWAVIVVTIVTYVCYTWYQQGCEFRSLLLAILWHGGGWSSFGIMIDNHICERYK